MKKLTDFSSAQLKEYYDELCGQYENYKAEGLSINMARGKPSAQQLDFSDSIFNLTTDVTGYKSEDGTDCRNYGVLFGIEECRKLFAGIFGVSKDNVIACGSSSLNLMFDYISQCCTTGIAGCEPWIFNKKAKFLAVVPGYDRHFAIAEHFGLEMINVPMDSEGPDMDIVEELIRDPDVKGMFCVPKYSNPNGVTYSDKTVSRLAKMKPAAKDFRVIWDEAYIIHDLYDTGDSLMNIFDEAAKYGNEDNFIAFTSTSKITYAGAGVSAIAASDANIAEIAKRLTVQIISYDKMNQLRHSYFFKSVDDVKAQMKKHASVLRPKFDAVLEVLDRELEGLDIARWSRPGGGYFISLDVVCGSAKRVGELCRNAGIVLTNVGATYPYGKDPGDMNIRLAPSCPTVDELHKAIEVICLAVKMAACEYLSGNK